MNYYLERCLILTAVWMMVGTAASPVAHGQGGHGPVFGLATPTLPQGAWNVDGTAMSAARGERGLMVRQTTRYGLTPHVQLNLSVPLTIRSMSAPPHSRIGTMMGGMGDAEASALWRFHREYLGVGKRFESTLLFSALYPTRGKRGGVDVGPGVHAAAVTGYASRTIYVWAGAGFQRYLERNGDQSGDLGYISAVAAWRPPVFQGDYPKPDWRIFIESLAEFAGRDRRGESVVRDSGGQKIFAGPTVLGLYGSWGIGAGILFPLYQNLNGTQPGEGPRLTVNLSYWF